MVNWLVGVLVVATSGAQLASEMSSDDNFAQCKAALKERAKNDGITPDVVDRILDGVQHSVRIIELDQSQPEFTRSFSDYYLQRVTDRRVELGRNLIVEHADLLAKIKTQYGIPAHYLMAFWGLETNFGNFLGNTSVPDSLTTLACDPRRRDFFTTELMGALRILDAGDVDAQRMEGSWAGAMGQFQFMPSVFLRYAVDGDGDGRRDLWANHKDALYSAANFLQQLGWQTGLRWGREVVLPAGFDYGLANIGTVKPLSQWRTLGLKDASGSLLPGLEIEAKLLVPSGHKGPAFIAYHNFDVIMKWNRSESYAITVGRLADRIAGAEALSTSLPIQELVLTRDLVIQLQYNLNNLGFDAGKPDGLAGPGTRAAVSRFQQAKGMIADGYINSGILDSVAEHMPNSSTE